MSRSEARAKFASVRLSRPLMPLCWGVSALVFSWVVALPKPLAFPSAHSSENADSDIACSFAVYSPPPSVRSTQSSWPWDLIQPKNDLNLWRTSIEKWDPDPNCFSAHIWCKDGNPLGDKYPINSDLRRPRWRRMAAVRGFRAISVI